MTDVHVRSIAKRSILLLIGFFASCVIGGPAKSRLFHFVEGFSSNGALEQTISSTFDVQASSVSMCLAYCVAASTICDAATYRVENGTCRGYDKPFYNYKYILTPEDVLYRYYIWHYKFDTCNALGFGYTLDLWFGTNMCIKYHPEELESPAATTACMLEGSKLVKITSADKQAFVWKYLEDIVERVGTGLILINGYRVEPAGTWWWSNSEMFTYTNWRPGEPNDLWDLEDCLAIEGTRLDGGWSDIVCDWYLPFICERVI